MNFIILMIFGDVSAFFLNIRLAMTFANLSLIRAVPLLECQNKNLRICLTLNFTDKADQDG
jgi:hypothetical protein